MDAVLGNALERAIRAHHRRRLTRLGHASSLDPPETDSTWAAGAPPPRDGCEVEVLIDGAEAFPRMLRDIRAAASHVHIAGWHVDPDFALTRDGEPSQVRRVLRDVAERVPVRALIWGGAPFHGFTPSRGDVKEVRAELLRGSRVVCALDPHERTMHCHHEKIVIVDDEIAYVGGLDITSLAGDRFDSSEHAERGSLGWHDVAVRLRGPVVADVAQHFADRWLQNTGERVDPVDEPAPAGDSRAQFVRTLCDGMYDFAPTGDFRVLESYRRALRSAQRLIYLENQFLWAPEIVEELVEKVRDPPCDEFRLVVLLPAKPNNGAEDTRGQLAVIADHDADGRFLACTVHSRTGARSGPLYVHAKVGIVDDRWLMVGSANLNAHSLFNDSEAGIVTDDTALVRATRLRLWAEHLERSTTDVDGPAHDVIDHVWRPIADEQLARRRADLVLTHRLMRLEAASKRLERLRGPLQGLVVDG
jgi:phosphatidylserine/phosphatidylglycerophosphate/cardiolipin synthase-like enzyme